MNYPLPSTEVPYATEDHPPQYTLPKSTTKGSHEDKHPVLIQCVLSNKRREIYFDKYGIWTSTLDITKRLYLIDISPTWGYVELLDNLRAFIPEPKDRPIGTWSGAGIVEAAMEKVCVVWVGGEDWTEINEESWERGRVWKMMHSRGWRDMLKVSYADLGPSFKVVARAEEKNSLRGKEKSQKVG